MAQRKTKPAQAREIDPGPMVSFFLPLHYAERLGPAWRIFAEREQLRMDAHKSVQFRIEAEIVGHIAARFANSADRTEATTDKGETVVGISCGGPAACWLKIANWCCREMCREVNRERKSRPLIDFHAGFGLIVTRAISPVLIRGRGYAQSEDDDDREETHSVTRSHWSEASESFDESAATTAEAIA